MPKYNVNFYYTIQVDAKNSEDADTFARNLMKDNFRVRDADSEVEEIKEKDKSQTKKS